MKTVKILPNKLQGFITPPESKSLAHRSIIAASLSKGKSRIRGIDNPSLDILATIQAMEKLGAKITNENPLIVDGNDSLTKTNVLINCNESGSTLRFLIPIALVSEGVYKFTGRGLLGSRPLDPYYEVFKKDDIYYKNSSTASHLDLVVNGKLKGGEYEIRGDISSQFVTGLLFALPLLENDSKLIITTDLESKGYVDLTLSVLEKFGIDIKNINYKEFIIKGNQSYKKRTFTVEKDFSQAAFYFCAAAIGNDVMVKNMNLDSSQRDKEILDFLIKLGCDVLLNEKDNYIKVVPKEPSSAIIDGSEYPDIIPILTVVAALTEGETTIKNIKRLRIKESDRIESIKTELNKIGANIESGDDYMIINGVTSFTGGEVESWNDHRIAMSLAIASTRCESTLIINGADCVKKSYPHFFADFKKLGGIII